jgi:hypothetical protein
MPVPGTTTHGTMSSQAGPPSAEIETLGSSLSYTSFEGDDEGPETVADISRGPGVTSAPGSVTSHRMSLLLRMQPAAVALIFSGSGATWSPTNSSSGTNHQPPVNGVVAVTLF